MADKTRDELKKEITDLQEQLKEKQKEDSYKEPALVLGTFRSALIEQGFTPEEAYDIVLETIKSQNNVSMNFGRGGVIK